MSIIEQFLRFIAPHHCLGCGSEGRLLCAECAVVLPVISSRCYACGLATEANRVCERCRKRSRLCSVAAATPYNGLAKKVIHHLKFEHAKAAAEDIAELLASRVRPD